MPQFLDRVVTCQVVEVETTEPYVPYLQEYRELGDDFHSVMSFVEFYNLKSRNRLRGGNRSFNNNHELQHMMGKLTIPDFDGSSKRTTRTWVHKLDIYFQLN